MAKRNPYEAELFKNIQVRVFDQNAWTVEELKTKIGMAASTISKLAKEKCELGEWERVWKVKDNRQIPAYRPKK